MTDTPTPSAPGTGDDMSPLELDLLTHLVIGNNTHRDGRPLTWGAWMSACLESLQQRGYVRREGYNRRVAYFATDAGRSALEAASHG